MTQNLNKYLSEVFRKVTTDTKQLNPQGQTSVLLRPVNDLSSNQFILDKKYSLNLDEIA
jgi:hypothetical protein